MGIGKTIGCVMSVVINQVRTGVFLDSVVLMRISRELAHFEGIEEVELMIGTQSVSYTHLTLTTSDLV